MRRVPLILLLTMATSARAQTPPREPPDERFVINNLFVLRVNPLGLEDQMRAGFQQRLTHRPGALFRDNFLFAGVYPKLNPAFVKVGPSVEIQPVSMFNLRIAAEFVSFFGTFGFVQSFESPLDSYHVKATAAGPPANNNYATSGAHLMIEPTVMLKFGPIVVRDKFAAEYWKMNLRAGDHVWFDATLDTLVPGDGWVLTNDLDVMYMRELKLNGRFEGARLVAGIRYSMVKPLYDRSDFRSREDPELEDNAHHRVGPIAAFTFFDHGFTRFNKPTLVLIVNWYLDHRFRTGQEVSGAVPYLILGFAFQSDLLR